MGADVYKRVPDGYWSKIRRYGLKKSFQKIMHRLFAPKLFYYSEQGEDILLSFYCTQDRGFYVDVGAYHPKRLSVTRKFYEKGWRGINIEPNPSSKKIFDRVRRRDINLNVGVADKAGALKYFYWDKNNTSNTFDAELYERLAKERGYGAKKIIDVKVDTLNNILEEHLPPDTEIDFLTIDIEGYELKVLQSFDFDKFGPKHILVEELRCGDQNIDFMDFRDMELYKLLNSKGYIVVAKTWFTILFRKKT